MAVQQFWYFFIQVLIQRHIRAGAGVRRVGSDGFWWSRTRGNHRGRPRHMLDLCVIFTCWRKVTRWTFFASLMRFFWDWRGRPDLRRLKAITKTVNNSCCDFLDSLSEFNHVLHKTIQKCKITFDFPKDNWMSEIENSKRSCDNNVAWHVYHRIHSVLFIQILNGRKTALLKNKVQ